MMFPGAVLAVGVLLLGQAASTLTVLAPVTWGLWLGLRVVLAVSPAAAAVVAAAAALAARHWRKWRGSGNDVSRWVRRVLGEHCSRALRPTLVSFDTILNRCLAVCLLPDCSNAAGQFATPTCPQLLAAWCFWLQLTQWVLVLRQCVVCARKVI